MNRRNNREKGTALQRKSLKVTPLDNVGGEDVETLLGGKRQGNRIFQIVSRLKKREPSGKGKNGKHYSMASEGGDLKTRGTKECNCERKARSGSGG